MGIHTHVYWGGMYQLATGSVSLRKLKGADEMNNIYIKTVGETQS